MRGTFFVAAVFAAYSLTGASAVQAEVSEPPVRLSAHAAAVIEYESGRLIFAKNEDERLPMASTTKIMTAVTVIMLERNIDKYVDVSAEAASTPGSSMGLRAGDRVTVRTLLTGLLLESGNDAAAQLAELFGKEAFADIMNEVASKHLELKNTSFTNPHGLPDEKHYSTARDMAEIMRFAVCFELFNEITAMKYAVCECGERTVYLSNHNRLLTTVNGCDGGKTGWTASAGRCLVSTAKRNGVRLICVTLDAPDDWNDHARLYDAAFGCLSGENKCFEKSRITAKVTGGERGSITLVCDGARLPLLTGETVTRRIVLPAFLYAPVQAGETVGRADYVSGDKVIASSPVYAEETCAVLGAVSRQRRGLFACFCEILL